MYPHIEYLHPEVVLLLNNACVLAKRSGSNLTRPIHILASILFQKDNDAIKMLKAFGVDIESLNKATELANEKQPFKVYDIQLSTSSENALAGAYVSAISNRLENEPFSVSVEHLIVGMMNISTDNDAAKRILASYCPNVHLLNDWISNHASSGLIEGNAQFSSIALMPNANLTR